MTKATELREFASLLTVASGQIQFDTDIKISGDLITTGNTINITADTLNISDPNITLASGAANSAIADGAGITIDGANATLTWNDAYQTFTFNTDISTSGNIGINGVSIPYFPIDISAADGGRILRSIRGTSTFRIDQSSDGPGYINMESNDDLNIMTNNQTRMTILAGGNVGITRAVPTHKLDVEGTSIRLADNAAVNDIKLNIYGGIDMGGNGTGFRYIGTDSNEEMSIRQNSIQTIKIERNTRHVIIGDDVSSTSPDYQLDVVGDINARESFRTEQVRHSIRPTLNLDFANSKQLDPRITFYRDSIATYYDSKGVLRYANVNEPRFDHDPVTGESKGLLIEEARTNVMPYSSHPGLWDPTYNTSTAIYQSEVLAPDGTMSSADFISTTSSSSDHVLKGPVSTITSGTVTASLYVKSLGVTVFRLAVANTAISSRFRATFNLNTLAITATGQDGSGFTYSSSSITPVGNDWYKITLTGSVGAACRFYMVTQDTNEAFTWSQTPGTGLTVWGGQIESGAFATSFVPSDTRFTSRSSVATYYDETGILRTAPANSPRYGYKYDGRKWVETGLILENAATNYYRYSEAGWISNYSYIPNCTPSKSYDVTAPDGSNLTTKLTFTANGNFDSYQSGVLNYGSQMTISLYVYPPASGATWYFGLGDAPSDFLITTFTYSNGQMSTSDTGRSGYEKVGNTGWWRIWATNDVTDESGGPVSYLFQQLSGAVNFYIWGMQAEIGYRPTSWIGVNSSAATTRSADVASSVAYTRQQDKARIDGQDFIDFYLEDEGTFYAEYEASSTGFIINISSDNVNVNNMDFVSRTSGGSAFEVYSNSALVSQLGVGNTSGKIAGAYKNNDFALSTNGGSTLTDTTGQVASSLTQLVIGNRFDDLYSSNSTIKKISYYPERLSNAELQALTENN